MKWDALLNVVSRLQVAYEARNGFRARHVVMVIAGMPKHASRPIAAMRAGMVFNDSRNMQIAAVIQGLQVIIDNPEQIISLNQLTSHSSLLQGFKGILA